MGEISVTFEALEAGSSGIRSGYARLTGSLEQLGADLRPMIGSWSGAAQEAYLIGQQRWNQAAAALAEVLNSVGSAVEDAHANYVAAEAAARANWT